MFVLLLIYSYIFFTSYTLGFAFIKLLAHKLKSSHHLSLVIISLVGLGIIAFLVQILHFWLPIGLAVHIFIFSICLISIYFFSQSIYQSVLDYFQNHRIGEYLSIIIYSLYILAQSVIFVDYPTDEAYYYLPSIQWLIQYPVVLGLGNIAITYAYNATWFVLDAFYGFFFLGNHFFNDLNGYVAILVFLFCLEGLIQVSNHKAQLSDYFKIGLFFIAFLYFKSFLLTITPNFGVIVISFILFCLLLDWLKNPSLLSAYVMVFLAAFAFTIRISAIPLLLIPLFFGYGYAKQKKYLVCIGLTTSTFIIVMPYLLHNIITTGYLLNPVRILDFFAVDWKVDPQIVIGQDHILKPFLENKALNGINNTYIPTSQWYYLHFFKYTSFASMAFHALVFSSWISIWWIYKLVSPEWDGGQKKTFVFIIFLAFVGMLMWLFLLPTWYWAGLKIAAGFLFFLVLCHWVALVLYAKVRLGKIYAFFQHKLSYTYLVISILHFIHIERMQEVFSKYAWKPADFKIPQNMTPIQVNDIEFQVRSSEDQHGCWGAKQPCVQADDCFFEMRGKTMAEGFKPRKTTNSVILDKMSNASK